MYFTNWKAEQTTSTFNDEWDLKWNFNIENKEGIGFHQYALPGYPASHSCLRLKEADAKYLYTFADQWELKGTDDIKAKGTPVIVSVRMILVVKTLVTTRDRSGRFKYFRR